MKSLTGQNRADNENLIIWPASITRWRKFENGLLVSVHQVQSLVNICAGASICRLAVHLTRAEFYFVGFEPKDGDSFAFGQFALYLASLHAQPPAADAKKRRPLIIESTRRAQKKEEATAPSQLRGWRN